MMTDPVKALAEVLQTMDGNIETFWRRSQQDYSGYPDDAREVMRRLERRGWRLARIGPAEDADPYPQRW